MKAEFQVGKVKQYNADKGFGFIALPEHADVFFHISDFETPEQPPKRNEKVKFLLTENQEKYKATKIQRVEDQSKKAKKAKVAAHNQSISSALLNQFRLK